MNRIDNTTFDQAYDLMISKTKELENCLASLVEEKRAFFWQGFTKGIIIAFISFSFVTFISLIPR